METTTPIIQQIESNSNLNMMNGESSFTEKELEGADILINLPFYINKLLTPNCNDKGEEVALSPNTPLSHDLNLSDDSNLNHSSKPSRKRKKSKSNKKTKKSMKMIRIDESMAENDDSKPKPKLIIKFGNERSIPKIMQQQTVEDAGPSLSSMINDSIHASPSNFMQYNHQHDIQYHHLDTYKRRAMAAVARRYRILKMKEKRTRRKF